MPSIPVICESVRVIAANHREFADQKTVRHYGATDDHETNTAIRRQYPQYASNSVSTYLVQLTNWLKKGTMMVIIDARPSAWLAEKM